MGKEREKAGKREGVKENEKEKEMRRKRVTDRHTKTDE